MLVICAHGRPAEKYMYLFYIGRNTNCSCFMFHLKTYSMCYSFELLTLTNTETVSVESVVYAAIIQHLNMLLV